MWFGELCHSDWLMFAGDRFWAFTNRHKNAHKPDDWCFVVEEIDYKRFAFEELAWELIHVIGLGPMVFSNTMHPHHGLSDCNSIILTNLKFIKIKRWNQIQIRSALCGVQNATEPNAHFEMGQRKLSCLSLVYAKWLPIVNLIGKNLLLIQGSCWLKHVHSMCKRKEKKI